MDSSNRSGEIRLPAVPGNTRHTRNRRSLLRLAAVAGGAAGAGAIGLGARPLSAGASPLLIGEDNDAVFAETILHGSARLNRAVLRMYNQLDGFALHVSGRSRAVFAGSESGVGLHATGVPAIRALPDATWEGKAVAIEAAGRLSFSSAALVKVAGGEKTARFTGFVLPRGALVLATVQERRAGPVAARRIDDETVEVTLDRAAGPAGVRVAVFVIEPPGLRFPDDGK